MYATRLVETSEPMEQDRTIGLQEAADRLGVHYMTAYRYVRTGRLDAERVGGEWRVDPHDLDALRSKPRAARSGRSRSRSASAARLEERFCANDEAGAWQIVEETLASGAEPLDVLLDMVAPAMAHVGTRWESGELSVADEHRATAVAQRVVGRLGPRFARRGRKRGRVVIGAPAGDNHALPVAIAADVLRGHGIEVVELGANTPAASFAEVAALVDDLLAVVITVTSDGHARAIGATVRAVRAAGVDVPIVVGGASAGEAGTRRVGADWSVAGDARALVALIDQISA